MIAIFIIILITDIIPKLINIDDLIVIRNINKRFLHKFQ
jgi:hypothetical protein